MVRPIPTRQHKRWSAGSYSVLLNALPKVRPVMPLNELRRNVQIGSPSPSIVLVSAKGENPPTQKQPLTLWPIATSAMQFLAEPGRARRGADAGAGD